MANFKDTMAMCSDGGSNAAISAALGCSNRDIAKTKTLIADLSITKEESVRFFVCGGVGLQVVRESVGVSHG